MAVPIAGAALERLTDAEVDSPWPLFGLSIHPKVRNGIELVSKVDACRTDRSEVPQSGTSRVQEVTGFELQRVGPHVAVVEKRDAPELAHQRHADFRRAF